jgi:uncharacterized membrane protein YfcA
LILGLTTAQLGIALAATLAASFVRGLAGFGMAILLVPVLALAVAPAAAVVVSNWLVVLIGLVGARTVLAASERSAFVISGFAVLATPLGVWLLMLTDPELARLLIALLALGAFALMLLPKKPADHVHHPGVTGATGIAAGVLTGFAGMPGPPVVPYYLGRQIAPELARASMMTIFLATALAGIGAALGLGLAGWRELWLALLLFPVTLLGNWLGHQAFGRIGDAAWRGFTAVVLGASALAAVWRLLQG